MKRVSVEKLAVCEIWILFLLMSVTDGKYTKLVGMDKKKVCRDHNSVMVDYLKETESALILAKTVEYKDASESKDCNVILGPDSLSQKQFLLLEFESFHMPDCDVELIIHQCPFVTFDRDIILMSRLGCKDRNPKFLMTKKKHNVRFILHREYVTPKRVYNFRINVTLTGSTSHSQIIHTVQSVRYMTPKRVYNFRINLTLTDGVRKHEDNLSLGLKIGIVGVSVIAAIIVAIMVFKAVRLRLILRQDYHQEEEQESHHVLTSLSNSCQRLQPNSYTELADQGVSGSRENQYMNADPSGRYPVEVQLAVTAAVPRSDERHVPPPIPRDNVRHTYANIQQTVSPIEGTGATPALPPGRGPPESPPSYEEAIDMPIPIPASPAMDNPSPLYQNLNTIESC